MKAAKLATATVACLLLAGCGAADSSEKDLSSSSESIVRGTVENGRNYVLELRIENTDGSVTLCTGVLFSPRVVLTAAHCIDHLSATQQKLGTATRILAYIGNNYDADFAALVALGPGLSGVPPAPQPSRFMFAESWETHPNWNPSILFPDLAVVYLDRPPKLPPNTIIDGLPVGRTRLGAATVGKPLTIVGYGASQSLTADLSQTVGGRIKRRGTSPFVGEPIRNPLPPDPHPGLSNVTVRNGLMQLNGTTPNSNGCAGDSGGPAILNVGGQDYVFGIASWVGNFCESFSYYTRLDPFLPFVDASYKKGGQAPIAPLVSCVAPRAAGGFRAYFGYNNQNGVTVPVSLGTNNASPQDTANRRPTSFAPGTHQFQFGVNFNAGQTATYRLSAPSGPGFTVTANANSPRCNVNDRSFICAQACDASQAAACGESMDTCESGCVSSYPFVTPCEPQLDAFNRCVATLSPSEFFCAGPNPFDDNVRCGGQLADLFACLGF